jgi:hypothetical protein
MLEKKNEKSEEMLKKKNEKSEKMLEKKDEKSEEMLKKKNEKSKEMLKKNNGSEIQQSQKLEKRQSNPHTLADVNPTMDFDVNVCNCVFYYFSV